MTKRIYIALIILMSLSLTGIIGLQVYWITESIKVKEKQFSQMITQSLIAVSSDLKLIDVKNFAERYSQSRFSKNNKSTSEELLRGIEHQNKSSIIDKKRLAVDAEFLNFDFVISHEDSIRAINITSVINSKDRSRQNNSQKIKYDFLKSFNDSDSISVFQLALLEEKYLEHGNKISIRKRVKKETLERLLSIHLSNNNIRTRFEYAIMSNGLTTPVYTRRFKQTGSEYVVPIFSDKFGESIYELYVQFPEKRDFVLSTMRWMLFFSVIFTLIIVFTYAGALYLIFRHRKTSQVKTDFINNMTHELKTPIATISLAIDAIKNPKILSNTEKIIYYANVIKDENKRMHQQIENVLRISRLDRNSLELSQEEASFNELVEEAIEHLLIIVEDRGGTIEFDLDADRDIVFVDVLHISNILVNMLDNANKYSLETPQINVLTYNEGNNVIVEVRDKGIGISKSAQSKVFDKFFRVSRGNVHNIKGQGLGLAYVKLIVDAHDGLVSVTSSKGKGSAFKVSLPLYENV
ncbi:MAG: HAMP domain-containing histidine kinase [Flavobacteriales bacterium]|nr:HAMP domain-containing histidine kinase [Flavobacteriales bacterium]